MLIEALPINSIFLSTDNGFYISESLFAQLRCLGLIPVASRFVDDDTETTDPEALRTQCTEAMSRINEFKRVVQSVFPDPTTASLGAGQRNHKLAEIERLTQEAELLQREADIEENLEQEDLKALKDTCELESVLAACSVYREEIAESNKNCLSKKEELLKLQFLFESRQLKLLAELNAMYPIERLESSSASEYSIRGVELHLDSG
jgi:hypothetical protein